LPQTLFLNLFSLVPLQPILVLFYSF